MLYETNLSVIKKNTYIFFFLQILNLGMTKLFLLDVFSVIQDLHVDIY